MASIDKEYKYYSRNQKRLSEKYDGRVIVIKDGTVIGEYETELDAVLDNQSKYDLGSFLVQRCNAGEAVIANTFHSRVLPV